jgi:hypothetical protein
VYTAPPDAIVLALAQSAQRLRACAPFVNLFDVKHLPGERRAVLYGWSLPCDSPAEDAPAWPGTESREVRLGIFGGTNPSRLLFAFPVPGNPAPGVPSVDVFQVGPGIEIYEIRHDDVSTSTRTGRTWVHVDRRLFTVTENGRAGEPLELPHEDFYSDGGDPIDEVNLLVSELDGAPPAEVVVELKHIETPSTDGPDDARVPDVSEFSAYRLSPDRQRFERSPMTSAEIATKHIMFPTKVSSAERSWELSPEAYDTGADDCP